MDILKTLNENADILIPEDLDFIETEIHTGGYDEQYQTACLIRLGEIRNWRNNCEKNNGISAQPDSVKSGDVVVNPQTLTPAAQQSTLSNVEFLKKQLNYFRTSKSYKTLFKDLVKNTDWIDEKFADENLSIFEEYEIDALIELRQFSEDFLEKYFNIISHEKIARYQYFSESFYMKHFSELDSEIVFKGKNEWRIKENRSKQFDVFLRLKGIKQ